MTSGKMKRSSILWFLAMCCMFGNTFSEVDGIKNSITDFGVKLFHQLNDDPGNLVCSTFNVYTSLTGLKVGANGNTAVELKNVLGASPQEDVLSLLHNLLKDLNKNPAGYSFSNAISFPPKTNLLPPFKSIIEDQLLIQSKDSKGGIAIDNVLNLNGVWKYQFDKSNTKKEPFYYYSSKKEFQSVDVQMMYIKTHFDYAKVMDMNAELLEIPFVGDRITLVIVRPNEMDGLADLNTYLSVQQLNRGLREMGRTGIHLRLPSFTIKSSLSLKKHLNTLGITDAFQSGIADFSSIDGTRHLVVMDEHHEAMIQINEKGSMPPPPNNISNGLAPSGYEYPPMAYFTVDHPFMFLVRDKPTGTILAMGQVRKP